MALGHLGTSGTALLNALVFNPAQAVGKAAAASTLAPADLSQLNSGILSDQVAIMAVKTTGNTHTNTTLDTIASMAGIRVGMYVFGGIGIPPGTTVAALPGGSVVTLSVAATSSVVGVNLLFVPINQEQQNELEFSGQLYIPRRGVIKVFPGDVLAVDPVTGWPILVSAQAIAAAGSVWVKT